MAQFYISKMPPEVDVRRCKESIAERSPITITGITEAGDIKAFTGVVTSIKERPAARPSWRWLVTIEAT